MRALATCVGVFAAMVLALVGTASAALAGVKPAQYILIENAEDSSFGLDSAKTREIEEALDPYKLSSEPLLLHTYGPAIEGHLDYVAVKSAKIHEAMEALSKVRGVVATPMEDVLHNLASHQATMSVVKPVSMADLRSLKPGNRYAYERIATFNYLTSPDFQKEIPNLSAEERYVTSVYLLDAISPILNVAGIFSHEIKMEVWRRYRHRANLDNEARTRLVQQGMEKSEELLRVRDIAYRHTQQAVRVANQIQGGFGEAGLLITILGGVERTWSAAEVDGYFDVVEREFQNQVDLGNRLADLHRRGRAADLMRQSSFQDLMNTSQIRIELSIDKTTGLYFFEGGHGQAFAEQLYSHRAKWLEILNVAKSRNPAVAKRAADRIVQLVEKFDPLMAQMLENLKKNLPANYAERYLRGPLVILPYAKLRDMLEYRAAGRQGGFDAIETARRTAVDKMLLDRIAQIGTDSARPAAAAAGSCEALFKAN